MQRRTKSYSPSGYTSCRSGNQFATAQALRVLHKWFAYRDVETLPYYMTIAKINGLRKLIQSTDEHNREYQLIVDATQ